MVSKYAPGLEPREDVLDACSTLAVGPPCTIADDAVLAKHRRDELGYTPVTAVGEETAMGLADCLDARASVMDRIVAIARVDRRGRNDAEVRLRTRTCALHDQR